MTSSDLPPIVSDQSAVENDLPVRNAAAVVITNDIGLVLLARRNLLLPEFPGVWSFPSIYERDGQGLWPSLASLIHQELGLELDGDQLIGRRLGQRREHRILMHLYLARAVGLPTRRGQKYDDLLWTDGKSFVAGLEWAKMGECMKCYADYLQAKVQ